MASTDCQESLMESNTIDSGEGVPFLNSDEFDGFWDAEAEKIGLTLEPGTFETIRSEVFEANSESSVGGINLCGLYDHSSESDECTPQIQAMIEVLCVKTRQEMSKLSNTDGRTADENPASTPYVGEEEPAQEPHHIPQGNQKKVVICQGTNSDETPYTVIKVPVSAVHTHLSAAHNENQKYHDVLPGSHVEVQGNKYILDEMCNLETDPSVSRDSPAPPAPADSPPVEEPALENEPQRVSAAVNGDGAGGDEPQRVSAAVNGDGAGGDEPQRVSAAVGPAGGPVGNPNTEGQGKPQQSPSEDTDTGRDTELELSNNSGGGPMGGPVGNPNVEGQGKPQQPASEESPSEDPGRDTGFDTDGPSGGGGPMGGPVGNPNIEGQGKPQQPASEESPSEDTGRETGLDTQGPPQGIAGGPVGNPDQGQGLGKPPQDDGREISLDDSDEGPPPGPAGGPIGDPNLGQAKPPQDNGKGEVDFETAPCAAEEEALSTCYESNDCLECEDMLEDQNDVLGGPPELFGGDMDEIPSYNDIVAAMSDYLDGRCEQMGASVCTLKQCCSPCEAELMAISNCGLEQGRIASESALAEMQEALSQFGGDETEEPLELELTCDLEAAAAGPCMVGDSDTSEEDMGEETNEEHDMCVEEETALNACAESNDCLACDQQSNPPEDPSALMSDPTNLVYNEVVSSFNDYFASQCQWLQDGLCTLKECCPPCADKLEAMYECQMEGFGGHLDPVKDMLEQFAELPDGEEPLEFKPICELENAPCMGGTEEDTDGGADERVTVDTAFIVSNKEGWTAQDIKESTDDLTSYLNEMILNTKFMTKLQNALDRVIGGKPNGKPEDAENPDDPPDGAGKLDGKPEDAGPSERYLVSPKSMGGSGKFGFIVDNAKVIDVTDVPCPNSTDVSECQRVDASFELEADDKSIEPERLARVMGTAVMQWIDSGKFQELLPDDAPYTIEQAIDLREEDSEDSGMGMESGDTAEDSPDEKPEEEPMDYPIESGVMDPDSPDDTTDEENNSTESPTPTGQPVLVNSTFLVESSDAFQTAKEMVANMDSDDIQRLVEAFQEIVNSVVKDLGGKAERHLRASGKNQLQERRLAATYDTGSAQFYDFKDTPCSQETAVSKQATEGEDCITVFGKYRVYADPDDNVEEVYQTHAEATQEAVADGKLAGSYVAIAEDLNMPEVIFAIQGVSPVVDEEFDPFAEIDGAEINDATAANVSTLVPVLNATEPEPESAAIKGVNPSLLALLVGAVSLLSYW